jgi:predicted tellurium resistance membrane protein TerC
MVVSIPPKLTGSSFPHVHKIYFQIFKLCLIYTGYILLILHSDLAQHSDYGTHTHTHTHTHSHSSEHTTLLAHLPNTVYRMVQSLSGSLWKSQTALYHFQN